MTRAIVATKPMATQRDLALAYADNTPVVTVSRCPFTTEPVDYPLDTLGTDGPCWDAGAPIRHRPRRPPTVMGITGKLVAGGDVEPAPFERHFESGGHRVHNNLMDLEGARAVLSQVPVGEHRVLFTTYFQRPVCSA